MKNTRFKIFLILIICFVFCALSFEFVLAQTPAPSAQPYTLLQKLPESGAAEGKTTVTGLSDYLTWLYRFALGAAIFLAVLKIVIGGIYIIVGGASETARTKGREMIEMALWGLLLAVSAWLLLYTINPDFVTGKFGIPPVTIESKLPPVESPIGTPPGPTTWPPGPPPAGTYSAEEARSILISNTPPISVNKAECIAVNQLNCTSLYGLPQSTVQDLKDLAKDYGNPLVITGGTEYWLHSTHGPGKPIVDLRYNPSLTSTIDSWVLSGKITSYQCESGGVKVPCGGSITPDHFHVVF